MVGFDVVRSRSIQRSFTVHGDAALAARARQDLVAEYGMTRSGVRHTTSAVTLGELLQDYLDSDQLWKPATVASHRHVVSTLAGDPVCRCRLQSLAPAVVRAAICRWRDAGMSVPKVSARWLLIRSAVSWAVAEGLLRLNPLAGMRGPARPLDQACRHLGRRANPTLAHDQVLQPSPLQVSLDAACPSRPWSNLPWPEIPAILSRPCGGLVIDLHFGRRHAAGRVFAGQAAQHGFAVVRLGAEMGCGDAGR